MAKVLDQVLVIDVECTCWEGGRQPAGQVSEIIEVGLCVVDVASLTRIEKRCMMVYPYKSHISKFCTDLTSITPEMVKNADEFEAVIETLINDYQSKDRLFASWGDYDRGQFHRNCSHYHQEYPFGPTHLNIKTLFSIAYGLPTELGIDEACRHIGLEMEGTHHRGVDDAWNIAGLFCRLLETMRQ